MKKQVGMWIDHRKTVIVTIENHGDTTQEILSNMEKHVRFANTTSSNSEVDFHGSSDEDTRDRQFDNHLDSYYDGIVALVREADAIWIFGPGEAKGELKDRLVREGHAGQIVGIDTTDKMTDNQIAAKVRDRFLRQ